MNEEEITTQIRELEAKRQKLADDRRRAEAMSAREKKESWAKTEGIDTYTSDDYCGLDFGTNGVGQKTEFYYGYEHRYCPEHGFNDKECRDAGDCEYTQWSFYAKVNNKIVMEKAEQELGECQTDEPFEFLLRGIAMYIRDCTVQK